MSVNKHIQEMSAVNRHLRKTVVLLRSPIISVPSFLVAWWVFVCDSPATLNKWSVLVLLALATNLLIGTLDVIVRLAKRLPSLQEKLKAQLEIAIEKTQYLTVLLSELLGEEP